MNPNIAIKHNQNRIAPNSTQNGRAEIHYPETEKKIVGETDFHYLQIELLHQSLRLFFAGRNDVYISADIMVYYEEGKPRRHFAPDLMVCFGIENKKRRIYKLWEEKIVPSVIFEIASNSTWEKDVNKKRKLYEKLGVAEYYIFDPEYKYLGQPLMAYHLEFGELVRQSTSEKRIFSAALNLELIDTGENLRVFDTEQNEFIPTAQELKAELDKIKSNQNTK